MLVLDTLSARSLSLSILVYLPPARLLLLLPVAAAAAAGAHLIRAGAKIEFARQRTWLNSLAGEHTHNSLSLSLSLTVCVSLGRICLFSFYFCARKTRKNDVVK